MDIQKQIDRVIKDNHNKINLRAAEATVLFHTRALILKDKVNQKEDALIGWSNRIKNKIEKWTT